MVDSLLGGRGVVAHGPFPPTWTWVYTADVPQYPFDPARAQALLAEAGWSPGPDGILAKDGRRFTFTLLTNQEATLYGDVAVIVQQQLREIGIEASVAVLEFRAMLARVAPPRFDFDALVTGYGGAGDPNNLAEQFHSRSIEQGTNRGGFRHARVDELFDANVTFLDRAQRAAAFKDIVALLAEEQAATFLFHPALLFAFNSDVRGVTAHSMLATYRANEWWLDRPAAAAGR
jgi:peptide/nickel transport system substrate-binding protein